MRREGGTCGAGAREGGFSLLEVTIATGIMLTVTAGVFSMLNPARGLFSTQPEVADMQQRLRVAHDALYRDLVMAGGGAYQGGMSGSLNQFFAPVLPYRNGSPDDDPPGTFKTDAITLMYVPSTTSQTGIADERPGLNSSEIVVDAQPGCPAGDSLCGFKVGMTVLMYDDRGHFDTFTIAGAQAGGQLRVEHKGQKLPYTGYQKNATKVVEAVNAVYSLKADRRKTLYQLMYYDGSRNVDVPLVDNVVGLTFEYYGDTSSGLVKLTEAELTDGPWHPSGESDNRFDADLLRIRKIGVTVRVQAAAAHFRGVASALFTHGGTSSSANQWVPDQEIRFQVAPRNLNLGR